MGNYPNSQKISIKLIIFSCFLLGAGLIIFVLSNSFKEITTTASLNDSPTTTTQNFIVAQTATSTENQLIPESNTASIEPPHISNTNQSIFTPLFFQEIPENIPPNSKSSKTSTTIVIEQAQTDTQSATPLPSDTFTFQADQIEGSYVSNQVLVKLSSKNDYAKVERDIRSLGFSEKTDIVLNEALNKIGYMLVEVPGGTVEQQISTLETLPGIESAEPNYLVFATDTTPNDSYYGLQYGLVNIKAPQGWDYATGSSNVTIAVLDTGIDFNNSDFSGKLVSGYDFYNNDTHPIDDNGHGTEVSAIAAAWSNNGFGIAGVSWGAKIMPVKVLSASGGGSYATVAAGIIWAADNGAKVINLSLGGSGAPSDTALLDAVNYANSKGVVLVASSGNTGSSVMYPAQYDHVIAVGATDSANHWASFSNSGPQMDLCAPGVSILTMTLSDIPTYKNGTSYAAPFVSGLAAILLETPGNSTPAQVEYLMKSTALDVGAVGYDNNCGAGLIQMDAALSQAIPPTPTPVPTATFTATWTPTPSSAITATAFPGELPPSGFSPEQNIDLSDFSLEVHYLETDLILSIPAINLKTSIVGVPQNNSNWDVTWLGENVGWLDGSAFPAQAGNTVITGHVWDADGTTGIFINLKMLEYGDQLTINAFGKIYTYEVRENKLINSFDVNSAFSHEEYDWITLLTCEHFDSSTGSYLFRRMIKAVLVRIE